MSPADRYAVVGHPVSHSKSPQIHAAFARQTGQVLSYGTLEAPRDGFAATVRRFIDSGGLGLNVTVPFKLEACDFVDALSGRADMARAVNTIIVGPDGATRGENTDGVGLLRDLVDNNAVALSGARVLIAGAGGAVRGVLEPLLRAEPAELVIANRTVARAQELREAFSGLGGIEACGYDDLPGRRFDLVINGTSTGLEGKVPPLPGDILLPHGCAYDMFYASESTAFVRWALERGAGKVLDGIGMLVEQAAESFRLWRGVRPDTAPVIAMLRGC